MANEKEEVIEKELSEEEQVAAMLKVKSEKTPGEQVEKKPAPAEEKTDDADDKKDKSEDKKDEKKEEKKPELSEKEITAKVKELEAKDEKDLTDDDKKFLEDNQESDDEPVSPDKFIEEEFGKEYDVKNMKDLSEFMETAVKITEERDELKAKLEAAEKKEPAYKSESQKKVAQFLEKTGYDPDKFPEGLMTYAQLMAMDLDDKNLDAKLVLEAEYVLDHPELTRDEARRKFEKTYNKKYTVNKEDFDKEDDLKDAEEDLRIEKKTAVAKAVKGLKKAQEEFKAQPSKDDKKEEAKLPEIDPAIKKGIEQSSSDLDNHLKENDQLIFSPTENEDDDFPYQFKDDQLKGIRAVASSILNNPSSYDKKGKLLAGLGSGVEDVVKRVADFLYGDDIRDKLFEHALTITAAKKIEELGEVKPNRKPKSGAPAEIDLSEEKQIEILMEKKKGKKAVTA